MSDDLTTTAATGISIGEWLDAISRAAEELFKGQLGLEPYQALSRDQPIGVSDVGSYVALVGDETSAQIGMVASVDACRALAKKMLAMEESEELDDADMCDAVGEIANILGGTTKRLVAERMPGFKLGLPLFMQGRLIASDRQEVGSLAIHVGGFNMNLIILRVKGA
jgi:CheY-specific phosphatase CheX